MSNESQILNKKIELIQWLSALEDGELIEKLSQFRKSETVDWWESTGNRERKSIEKGIADAEKGLLNDQSTARQLYEKWL